MDGATLPIATTISIPPSSEEATLSQSKRHGPDLCTICLEPIVFRAVATPCNHLSFDFPCLATWLRSHATCPLCKAPVQEVQYDFTSPSSWKTHRIAPRKPAAQESNSNDRQRTLSTHIPRQPNNDPSLSRRRQIYALDAYSAHIGALPQTQHAPPLTPSFFSSSPLLQTRARTFLRRDLLALSTLSNPPVTALATPRSRAFTLEYLIAILRTFELKGADGKAEDLVAEMLGRKWGRLMLHEVGGWLRSPFERLQGWDGWAQYPSFTSPELCAGTTGEKLEEG